MNRVFQGFGYYDKNPGGNCQQQKREESFYGAWASKAVGISPVKRVNRKLMMKDRGMSNDIATPFIYVFV